MSSRVLGLLLLTLFATVAVSACSQDASATAVKQVSPTRAVKMLDNRVVIDVRTPGEYATGHLAGAINIDVEAGSFAANIKQLDKEAPYLVYCRSGRRSAIAAAQMADAGFTDIIDAGGLGALANAGAPLAL